MDTVDGPYMTMKQRREKPANSFQSELRQKMRDRKKLGLTADVTSEESEGIDDGLDSEEENSFTRDYRMQHKRTDRPTSAKRRGKPDLGETMTASDASKWLKSSQSKKDPMSSLRETPPLKDSQRFSNQPSQNEIDKMFGSSPRSRTSPLDKKLRQSPVEDGLYSKGRTSPSASGSSLPKSLFGGNKSPATTQELTAEEKIFGRKTPTNEMSKEKEWKAPSFRRSPLSDQDRSSPSAELDRRGGRKTPVDQGLMPITESPRPVPRSRQGSSTSPKESKLRSRDSSPRSLSLESPRMERQKPKVDIFGRKEKQIELEDDAEKLPSTRERRRFQKEDRKTTIGQKTASGRTTPTGRTTPGGRKTPTGRETPTGRKTPTGKSTKFDLKGEREEESKAKKEPGLLDFLTDDVTTDKPKARSRSSHDQRSTERRQSNLKKSMSHDSITEEINAPVEQPSMFEHSALDEMTSKQIPTDQSSVCLELDRDPEKETQRLKEREKKLTSKNQRSDRREADDIISRVENAQSDPKQITKERPGSAKTQGKVVRPQPRHSLPGSRPSSAATDYSADAFNSTMSIRQAIFEEWRKTKSKEISIKNQEQKKKEEEAKKKKIQEEKDKKLESLASYNAWMKQKEETFVKEKQQKKKEEEKKKKEKEREELQKKKDAQKDFMKWKEVKDEKLIEEHKKKVEEKHRKQQEERELKKDKEKQNATAFRGWKSKKDDIIEESHHRQHDEKMRTLKKMKQTQREKEKDAVKQYNEWIKKKEEQELREAHMRRIRKQKEEQGEDDFRPPWSPASKIIPCGR